MIWTGPNDAPLSTKEERIAGFDKDINRQHREETRRQAIVMQAWAEGRHVYRISKANDTRAEMNFSLSWNWADFDYFVDTSSSSAPTSRKNSEHPK